MQATQFGQIAQFAEQHWPIDHTLAITAQKKASEVSIKNQIVLLVSAA